MTETNLKLKFPTIHGASSGSSKSSKARTPVDEPDTIQSKAFLSLLDLLGEGQIGGLVDGAKSIFLAGTALTNGDGSANYTGFEWEFRDGRQDQAVIDGFPSIETPFNVGTQIKYNSPQTITVNDIDADQVRVIVSIPSLFYQDPNTGDSRATTVQYQFSLSVNDGAFIPINAGGTDSPIITINDKSKSKYQRQHLISLPKPGNSYKIRITRLTADSTDGRTSNETYLDSFYEIINEQLSYPNSALVGIKINAEQFSDLPDRAYLVDGLYLRVPSNYNVLTRTYTGVWDGSFKLGVTSNPAWVLYDLLTNTRYGLGNYVNPSQINIAKLYEIGRYCDGMVDNGFGGKEPRFTLNTVITTQTDAYKLIGDVCSVFRGMSYWSGGMVQLTQDSPTDPVYQFNNSNVVDGMFNKVGSQRKDRHSAVHVQWNDPEDQYKQKIEYVEDRDLIASLGLRLMQTVAFGCTSRAQAHRIGLWILYTEKAETNLISFEVGLDSLVVMPGDIVQIHDQYSAGKRNGGRVVSSSRLGCKLDKPTKITAGSKIAIALPTGEFQEVSVNQIGDNITDVTFATQLRAKPLPNATWILIELSLVPVLGRVVGITQSDKPNQFIVSVVDHNPSKFASIEQGLQLESRPTTILDPTFSTPENLRIDEETYLIAPGQLASRLDVSWEGKSSRYFVSWRMTSEAGNTGWTQEATSTPTFSVYNVTGGAIYDFKVVAQAVTGKLSSELVGTYVALGTMNPPNPPTDLKARGDFRQIILDWVNPVLVDFDYVRIYENTVDDVETAYVLDRTAGNSYTRTGIPGLMKYWYWVTAVNKRGMESEKNSTAGTSAIAGFIAETDLDRSLAEKIDGIGDLIDEANEAINDALSGANQTLDEALARADAARALVSIEQLMREDTNVELKREVEELGVTLGDEISSQIKQVRETAVSDQQAIARQFTTMETRFGDNEAAFAEEIKARTDADSSTVSLLMNVYTITAGNHANLITEAQIRSDNDGAIVTNLTALIASGQTATMENVKAIVQEEQQARFDNDQVLAQQITVVSSQMGENNAVFLEQLQALSTANESLASAVEAVRVQNAEMQGLISNEATARFDNDQVLAEQITLVNSQIADNQASVGQQLQSLVNEDVRLAQRIDTVEATAAGFDAAKGWEFDGGDTGTEWVANDATITTVDNRLRLVPTGASPFIQTSGITGVHGGINNIVRLKITRRAGSTWNGRVFFSNASHSFDAAYFKFIPNPNLAIGQTATIDWKMDELTEGGTNWKDSTSITGLRVALGLQADQFDIDFIAIGKLGIAGYAAAQVTTKALAEQSGKLSTMWNIKLNLTSNGVFYAAGMGIGIENTEQGIAQSQIVFQANRFMVFDPDIGMDTLSSPFFIMSGKVMINTAMIGNATITNAMIGNVIYSDTIGANGRPVWLLSKDGSFELNGLGASTSRIMRSTFDRYYDANGMLRIEIGELIG